MSFIGSMIGTALLDTALGAALAEGIGTVGATALTGAVGQGIAGAGIGALGSAITGQDPGQGALMGGVTGGILGGVGGLGSGLNAAEAAVVPGQTLVTPTAAGNITSVASPVQSIPASGTANASFLNASSPTTQLASKIPLQQSAIGATGLTSIPQQSIFAGNNALSGIGDLAQGYSNLGALPKAGIGLGVGLGVNSLLPSTQPSGAQQLNATNDQDRANYLRYLRQYRPSLAPGYAAGGITDLDGYMSNAQNIPNSQNLGLAQGGNGTQNIPNQNEVADPEGYGSNSTTMMAGGGIVDWLVKNSLPGMIFDWKGASDVPLIGGMFQDQSQIANLTPEEKKKLMDMAAAQGKPAPALACGGIADLGGYSKGGNLLDGPGDGVSDDIPASIAGRQPARLASGEYVVPSRIVSELGNGSTDAGAKRLDMMVQKVNAGRAQTLGGKKYAKDTRAYKHLPV